MYVDIYVDIYVGRYVCMHAHMQACMHVCSANMCSCTYFQINIDFHCRIVSDFPAIELMTHHEES